MHEFSYMSEPSEFQQFNLYLYFQHWQPSLSNLCWKMLPYVLLNKLNKLIIANTKSRIFWQNSENTAEITASKQIANSRALSSMLWYFMLWTFSIYYLITLFPWKKISLNFNLKAFMFWFCVFFFLLWFSCFFNQREINENINVKFNRIKWNENNIFKVLSVMFDFKTISNITIVWRIWGWRRGHVHF